MNRKVLYNKMPKLYNTVYLLIKTFYEMKGRPTDVRALNTGDPATIKLNSWPIKKALCHKNTALSCNTWDCSFRVLAVSDRLWYIAIFPSLSWTLAMLFNILAKWAFFSEAEIKLAALASNFSNFLNFLRGDIINNKIYDPFFIGKNE